MKPGVPRSTRNPSMPSSVRAQTTAISATPPLVIHVFSPFSTQESPSRRAVVRMPAGFEPKSGSVRPKQPMAWPLCRRGSQWSLLFVRSIGVDGIHHQRALHRDEAAQAGIAAFDLLHDEAVFHVAHAGAAVAFEIGAEEAQFGHFGDQFRGKARVAEAIADDGRDALVGEAARGLPHQKFLLGEEGIDREVVYAAECHQEYGGI